MAECPEVSVVIPTRNRWRLLRSALRSALSQQDVQLEVIVVDDASTDETPGRLAGLADPRLRVVRNERNCSVAATRNRGITAARGEWIAFLDDDDIWAPRKLRMQLEAAHAQAAAFAYGAAVVIDEQNRVLDLEPAPDSTGLIRKLIAYNAIPGGCSNVVAKAGLVRRLGGFDERFSALADWDLWLRLADQGTAAACSDVLVGYREHGQNMHVVELDQMLAAGSLLAIKHRALSARHRVDFDLVGYSRWLALRPRRAGMRVRAARVYLHGALTYRDFGNVLRALRVLLDPRAVTTARTAPPVLGTAEPAWLGLWRDGSRGMD